MYHPPNFTQRELQVIPLLVSGATRAEMAAQLGVSAETIKKHVRSILKKFDATSLRDCIIEITQYHDQFIQAAHRFFVPSLKTTLHVHENKKDCEIVSEYDVLALQSGVDSISELYHTDGTRPIVTINETVLEPVYELIGALYTWRFPRELLVQERQQIKSRVTFFDAFGKNEESHFNNIADPTGYLDFGVEFHTNSLPQKVHFEIRQGLSSVKTIGPIQKPNPHEFRVKIDRPGYLKRYYVKWIWEL